jgi:phytanoyl-CoA hydroxylase
MTPVTLHRVAPLSTREPASVEGVEGVEGVEPRPPNRLSIGLDARFFATQRPYTEILAELQEQGYARVGRVLEPDQRALLQHRIDQIMLGEIRYEGMFFQRDTDNGSYEDLQYGRGYEGASLRYRKIEKLEKDPLFLEWIEAPLFYELASRAIGPELVIYRALIFNKAAETGGSHLPWHQDGGRFWGLDREPVFQAWTALDDADENGGCLEVIPESHRAGLVTPLGGVVPEKHVRAENADAQRRLVPAKAGEVILIHNHLWHRSSRSRSGAPRRALTVCYMDASTRCLRKKRAPREFFRVFCDRSGPANVPIVGEPNRAAAGTNNTR